MLVRTCAECSEVDASCNRDEESEDLEDGGQRRAEYSGPKAVALAALSGLV